MSEAPKTAPAPKKYQSYSKYKTDEEKKEEVCVCVCVCVCLCVCVCMCVCCASMCYLSQLMSAMIVKMGDQDDDHYHRRLWMVVTVMNGVTNLKQTQKL